MQVKGEEPPVQAYAFLVEHPHFGADTCVVQFFNPFSIDFHKRVAAADDDMTDVVADDEIRAGGRLSVMGARLERHIHHRFADEMPQLRRNGINAFNFGMRTTIRPVKTLADNTVVVHEHRANHRRLGSTPPFGTRQPCRAAPSRTMGTRHQVNPDKEMV